MEGRFAGRGPKKSTVNTQRSAPPAKTDDTRTDEEVSEQIAEIVKDQSRLQQFIIALTQALMRLGGRARSAVAMAALENASEALNMLSDAESEDDSHLFPQQQREVETPAE